MSDAWIEVIFHNGGLLRSGGSVEVSIFPDIFLSVISLVMCSNHIMLALC